MTSKLQHAKDLAAAGFWIFPLKPHAKTPAHKGWQEEATRDLEQLAVWFGDADHNIGIFTGKFMDDQALVVIDVDNKKGKSGDASLFKLELDGFEIPDTRSHDTPTGGRHIFFRCDVPRRQGVDVLGVGLDVRSRGGYVCGAGSVTQDGRYGCAAPGPVAPMPGWLSDRLPASAKSRDAGPDLSVGRDSAVERAARYLKDDAPLAIEGQGGDALTYKVCCRVKDFGVNRQQAADLLLEHWNTRCSPPWDDADLRAKVNHAYAYGLDKPGVAAPEADFKPLSEECTQTSDKGHPFEELNKEFAFVLAGGGSHILWETTDEKNQWRLEHLNTAAFHAKFAANKIAVGKRDNPVTTEWMEWKGRRSFDGVVFMPGQIAPPRFYNLWRGFAVEPWPDDVPAPREAQAGLDQFLDHALVNVCGGDKALFDWLIGYFAHLVQRPWDKPLVALAFKGSKGVGKNALIQCVADLLGRHSLVTSNRRYLLGNFNGHLENCLLFVLDEAFWSGDKQAEGIIKDLITGNTHVIEHKGKEPYTVDNRTRVVIIGNEDWLVPATHDERRFAVFEVGEGRKQDRSYFRTMRERMGLDGNRLLLRFLQKTDIARVDVDAAPATAALLNQKHSSLEPFAQFWLACLTAGRVVASDFGEGWPELIEAERLRTAFRRHAREHNIRSRLPDDTAIGREIKKLSPLFHKRAATGYAYKVPPLADCRAKWDQHIGHIVDWGD